jgi:hypothetical protein
MKKVIKLKESEIAHLVKRVLEEQDYTADPERGTEPREKDIKSMFGKKYGPYIPNDVIRYLRKNPQQVFKKLYEIYGEKSFDYLNKAKGSDDIMESHDAGSSRYMFFSNLEQMNRQTELLMDLDQSQIEGILENGHDWAQDHIAEAKNNMDQVFDFLMNEINAPHDDMMDDDNYMMESELSEKKKKNVPTNPSLWQSCLSWAKSRYKVCPSAYCNGAAAKRYKEKGGKWKKK